MNTLKYLLISMIILLNFSVISAGKLQEWLVDNKKSLASEKMPSVHILIGQNNETLESFSEQVDKKAPHIDEQSLFDLASMSKVLTGLGIQIVINQSKFNLDSSVGDILEQDILLKDKPKALKALKQHTIRELLQHESYLAEIYPDYVDSTLENTVWDNIYSHLNEFPKSETCKSQAIRGRKPYCYKDVHYMILGRVIEVLSKQTLVDFYNDYIFCPLNLDHEVDTSFSHKPIFALSKYKEGFQVHKDSLSVLKKMVPSYSKTEINKIKSPIAYNDIYKTLFHDPKVRKMGGVSGHAGIISSAAAFQQIIKVFLDARIVKNGVIKPRQGNHPQLGIPYKSIYQVYSRKFMSPKGRGLGVDINSGYSNSPSGGKAFGLTSFGHTGYTGTSFWVDACTGVYYIFLGNRTHVSLDISSISTERRVVAAQTIKLHSTKEICRYE